MRQLFQEAAAVAPCIIFIGARPLFWFLLRCAIDQANSKHLCVRYHGVPVILVRSLCSFIAHLYSSRVCADASNAWCADEIDAIAAKRETAQREMERRIVAQMLTCMDDLAEQPLAGGTDDDGEPDGGDLTRPHKHVVVIGTSFPVFFRQFYLDILL